MAVKIYISKDSAERKWAPDYFHEGDAVVHILQEMWEKFNHLPNLYIVMANLHKPYADMVILTERGMGIIEFKHHAGVITITPENHWLSSFTGQIHGGSNYLNPYRQVQSYASEIRKIFQKSILPNYLPDNVAQWQKLKFQTTVCFTNPNVEIDRIKKGPPVKGEPWDYSFSITTPTEIPTWAFNLKYELTKNTPPYEPLYLSAKTLEKFIINLGGSEWTEVLPLMPTGKPYAYLVLKKKNLPDQTIGLYKNLTSIGRDPDNDIQVPLDLMRVSRHHAKIRRDISQIFIEDVGSKHGTYVNGKPIKKPHALQPGQHIILGTDRTDTQNCRLEFQVPSDSWPPLGPTKSSTDDQTALNK